MPMTGKAATEQRGKPPPVEKAETGLLKELGKHTRSTRRGGGGRDSGSQDSGSQGNSRLETAGRAVPPTPLPHSTLSPSGRASATPPALQACDHQEGMLSAPRECWHPHGCCGELVTTAFGCPDRAWAGGQGAPVSEGHPGHH